jgi:hypothetical protein
MWDIDLRHQSRWEAVHTLASILGKQARWDEALELAPYFLNVAATEKRALKEGTEFIVLAAAAGHASKALEILRNSSASRDFEPLEIGLQIYLGKAPQTALEIAEVGRDVAARIKQKEENFKGTAQQRLQKR